mgnify:CR=1 FL=1
MIRTGEQYRDSLRDGREVWINGERVKDVTRHPQFKPLVDIRARIYDMQHEEKTQEIMTYEENGERFPIGLRLPFEKKDWDDKRRDKSDYDAKYESSAEQAERMLAEAAEDLVPLLLEHFPTLLWEDQDECLEIRPEDIPL